MDSARLSPRDGTARGRPGADPASVHVRCQLCGGRGDAPVYRRSFESMALGRVEVALVVCSDCGFLYTDPRPTREALARHYAEGDFASAVVWREREGDVRHTRFLARRTTFTTRHAPALGRGRLLDVGCSGGDFLAAVGLHGWVRAGLEPSRAAALRARGQGFAVAQEALEENHLPPEVFDVVTAFSVLEHVWDVREAVGALERLLAPGGLLVVEVPDATRAPAQVAEFFSVEHLSHFSPGSLTRLLRLFGLRVEALERVEGPALLAAARKVGREEAWRVSVADDRGEVVEAIERYARERETFEAGLRERFAPWLERWSREGARVAVYGAGEHTRFLLDLLPLRPHVVALLDGDPRKHGSRVHDLPVHAPEELGSLAVDAVVLSSEPFQEEMAARIAPLAAASGASVVRCYPARERAA